jgi:hypothetical protein
MGPPRQCQFRSFDRYRIYPHQELAGNGGDVSTLFGGDKTEWSTDLLFKKPFTLSDQVEFMIGVGPEWTFSRDGTKIASEVAADFMFWPTPDRKYGWFVEPSYSYSFSQGHEQSLGVSVGLLITIPQREGCSVTSTAQGRVGAEGVPRHLGDSQRRIMIGPTSFRFRGTAHIA